jgi:hypothetical protein
VRETIALDDGEHAVTEGFEPVLVHAAILTGESTASQLWRSEGNSVFPGPLTARRHRFRGRQLGLFTGMGPEVAPAAESG